MTVQPTNPTADAPLDGVAAALRRFARTIVHQSDAMRCRREADRLFELSDTQLARRGLTRDRIIEHAFARYIAI